MDKKRLESFIFAGELKDGEIATYDYTSANAEGCVYLLLIGEEYYIGSTAATVHDRVRKHLFDMMTGRHPNEKIQTAYNRVGWCKAYIILRTAYKGYRLMEKMLIMLMQPPRRDNEGGRDRGARRGGLAAPRHQRHRRARRLARRRQGDGENKQENKLKGKGKMKANELMIGDWVNYHDDDKIVPKQVSEITNYKQLQLNDKNNWIIVGEKYCEPIPLTDEILEANSWEKVPQPGCANPYHWQLSKYEDDKEDDAYLLYRVKAFETFFRGMLISISVPACEDISFRKQVEHVHELQHALRLCGIEKEIEL